MRRFRSWIRATEALPSEVAGLRQEVAELHRAVERLADSQSRARPWRPWRSVVVAVVVPAVSLAMGGYQILWPDSPFERDVVFVMSSGALVALAVSLWYFAGGRFRWIFLVGAFFSLVSLVQAAAAVWGGGWLEDAALVAQRIEVYVFPVLIGAGTLALNRYEVRRFPGRRPTVPAWVSLNMMFAGAFLIVGRLLFGHPGP